MKTTAHATPATVLAVLLALGLSPVQAQAQATSEPVSLTPAEQKSTAMSREWQRRKDQITRGPDGKMMFMYGISQPTVVCSPLRLCDIELEPGETVLNVHAGDGVRWKFDGARSGPNGMIPHILVKPVEAGLETSLVITTDRRAYHLHLKSSDKTYMARMGFDYSQDPNNVVAKLAATAPRPERASGTIPGMGSVDNLDFDYRVRGKARWKPIRVYNDGVKTYIEMPETIRQTEAPALLVIGPDDKESLVNYRLIGNRYVVDQVFDEAILVTGVGRSQSRVRVERRNPGADTRSVSYRSVSTREGG